jgi:spermidine/putrescine transport system permease protein
MKAYAGAVYAFLYLPIVVLIVYSFNRDGVGGFPPATLDARLVPHPLC